MNLTITKIQVEGNNVVSFLNGLDYQISMSQIMPQVPTYISYSYDTITITQDGIKSFQFTVYTISEVGGNIFVPLDSTNTSAEVQARTVEIYKLLVTSVFKGCCECGNTEPECSIQYTYGNGTDLGTILYDSGVIRVNYTTANNQDFTGFWPIIQNGSWIFIFSKTDPTVFGVYQLSNYTDGGPGVYAQFDATLISGPSTFVDGTQVCVDVTSVGGNLIDTLQETLIAGSTLTQNNTIDGGGFDLTLDNNASFAANSATSSLETNAAGSRIVSGTQSVEVTPTYVDIITPNHGTATTGMVLALDASGHVEYTSAGGGSGTVTSVQVDAGTGISISGTNPITTSGIVTVTNTAPDQVVSLSSGTGISTSGTYPSFTITNSAPDQVVSLSAGTGISTSGTYPSFTITNSAPDQTVSLGTTGTGLAVTGTYPSFTLQNTLPDQTVSLTAGSGISVTGTYPSFTIAATGGSGGIPFAVASGTDTYTATVGTVSSYTDGDVYIIRFTNGNTTGCTLNINGLGAKDLYRNNDGLLIGGDIWDEAEMICIYNSALNGFDCIGTSPNALFAYVTNDDSVTITKGQPVYAFSGTGDRLTVKLANNTTDATSAQTIGLVASSSIAANQKGIIIMQGLLTGLSILPTSTWADGDPVYLGATAGAITKTKQYAPNHLVYLGFVTTASNGSAGRLYVRVQNGYELDELHNVQAQSPTVNDVLYYFGGSPGQWKTASIPTVLGYTPVTNARTISTTAPLSGGGDLSANRTLSISQATTSTDGYLSSTDWNTFNGKQNNIGLTTVGTGVATLASPSAISFIRIKADNTVDTRTPSQVLTDLGIAATIILARDNATYSLTGTTTNTLVWSQLISANTLQANDFIEWFSQMNTNAPNGTAVNYRLYVNTSASLTGAQLIATFTNSVGTGNTMLGRNIFVTASGVSGNLRVYSNATSSSSSYGVSGSNATNITVDTTAAQYFIIAIQNGNTTATSSAVSTLIRTTR